jgi:hypothetical protein
LSFALADKIIIRLLVSVALIVTVTAGCIIVTDSLFTDRAKVAITVTGIVAAYCALSSVRVHWCYFAFCAHDLSFVLVDKIIIQTLELAMVKGVFTIQCQCNVVLSIREIY